MKCCYNVEGDECGKECWSDTDFCARHYDEFYCKQQTKVTGGTPT